jgi:hypothetical protein
MKILTDIAFTTRTFTIEDNGATYTVKYSTDPVFYKVEIENENGERISPTSGLGSNLINICEATIKSENK